MSGDRSGRGHASGAEGVRDGSGTPIRQDEIMDRTARHGIAPHRAERAHGAGGQAESERQASVRDSLSRTCAGRHRIRPDRASAVGSTEYYEHTDAQKQRA